MIIAHQAALPGFTLEDLEDEAIAFLRKYEPPEGYFVGFSGGKDSIVTLELARIAGVKHQAYFTDTGMEYPEIYRFIKKFYPDVIWLKPKMTMFEGIRKKMPPTRMCRWCCDVLKKDPAKHIPLRHRLMGIRAEESTKRASYPRIDTFYGQTTYKPIFKWKGWAVWEFIKKHRLPFPMLYYKQDRIGCQVCPFVLRHCDFNNGLGKLYKKACENWYANGRTEEKKKKYADQTFEQWWHWYVNF